MQRYRVLTVSFLALLGCVEVVVVLLNYQLDPLWCFGSVNRYNSAAIVIDQRLHKTNLLAFGPSGYDTLILGSSRTEPLNGRDFPGQRAFNYAVPAVFPDEFAEYVGYFKKRNGATLRRIYLGLDFFGTIENKPVVNKPPQYYLVQQEANNYRFTALLSADPLRKYLKGYFNGDYYYRYDRRENILMPRSMTSEERARFTAKRLAIFREKFYASDAYSYSDGYAPLLAGFARANKGIEIHAFTSPVSAPLFEELVRRGRYGDYERWLREIVGVFGSVRNFMTVNSVTANQNNFYDADHLYPEAATLVTRRLVTANDEKPASDFGDLVTRVNLESYLHSLRQSIERRYGPLPPAGSKEKL